MVDLGPGVTLEQIAKDFRLHSAREVGPGWASAVCRGRLEALVTGYLRQTSQDADLDLPQMTQP
jgi:hypothetical protein